MLMTFLSMNSMDDELLKVSMQDDGSLLFEWDPENPKCKIFNSWTENDFKLAIEHFLLKLPK